MKLALAAALSHHPQLLLLDEATSGLDPIMRDEILDVFLEFVQEEDHSILLSSHITSDLDKVADYITFIHDGKLIMTASKNDLSYQYAVMRCRENQFNQLNSDDILAYRKRDFQIDVLVSNGKEAERKYKDLFVGTGIGLSNFLHGCAFDQSIDILTLFALGISMSLFMGAIFFPIFFFGGEERSEVFLVISILCAFGIDLLLVSILNELLEPGFTTILFGAASLVVSSLLAFAVSYPLTVRIFRRKEY